MTDRPALGTIAWHDLTAPDAIQLRGFYGAVIGWRTASVDMGGYEDFNLMPPGGSQPITGICHARGSNADLPPQWLVHFVVEDVARAADTCRASGGSVMVAPRGLGEGVFCVIRDPARAVCALYQPPSP